jgi:hypothetical protein
MNQERVTKVRLKVVSKFYVISKLRTKFTHGQTAIFWLQEIDSGRRVGARGDGV